MCMSSLIISAIGTFCKKSADSFKKSKLGAAIENCNNKVKSRWHASLIMTWLKKECKGRGVVFKIAMLPFTFLEFLKSKIGEKVKASVDRSIFCELGRQYVHNFMALNTRFFGVTVLSSTVVYNALKFANDGGINKIVALLSVVSGIALIKNWNVTGFFEGSALINFIKACAGVKNITFSFYDEEKTTGKLRLAAGITAGVITGIAVYLTPIGILVPFALFGMLLVLEYPVTGVYAAVFIAPLIPFSSMPLAGVCIWTLFAVILKSLYDKEFKWRKEGVGVALILFMAVLFVSSVFSFAPKGSLVVWVMYFVFISFYFAVINTINSRQQLYGLLRLFVINGALVALYGVMQYVFGWTTTNAWIDEEMFEEETMRVFSTLANPNVLGEYLLLVLPVSIVFFLKDKARSLSKWVYMAVAGICFLCLILTQSRGCWLGFLVSAAIFITFSEGRLWAIIPLVLCVMPFVLPQTIIERLLSIGDMGDSSTSYRVFIWMGTMGILRHYLLGGIGMGEAAFSEVYPLFSYNAIIAPHSHNTFLQLLVEGGLPALFTFIAVLVVTFKSAHKSYVRNDKKSYDSLMILGLSSGIAGFLFQSLFDYTFYNYRVMAVFFMVIAIVVSFGFVKEGSKNQ